MFVWRRDFPEGTIGNGKKWMRRRDFDASENRRGTQIKSVQLIRSFAHKRIRVNKKRNKHDHMAIAGCTSADLSSYTNHCANTSN